MLKQFYRVNKVAGLAVHIDANGEYTLDTCILELKGQEVSIVKKIAGLKSTEALTDIFPTKTLLALNLSGKGILTKQINQTQQIDSGNFGTIMPNAKVEDFDVQQLINGDMSFVSVIRRSESDRWFGILKKLGYDPALLSLGPFVVQIIEPELNIYGEELTFNGLVIERKSPAQWLSYRYKSGAHSAFKIKIQQETLAEEMLLPYAAAFQLLLNNQIQPIAVSAKPFAQLLAERQSTQQFRANGSMLLFVFFGLLLINFGLFAWFDADNKKLTERLATVQQTTDNVRTNSEQIKSKEAILEGLGWDSGISKSRLTDQLAELLPADITLTMLTINPIKAGDDLNGRQLTFLNHTIIINGTAEKVLSVNEWVARIKTKSWVKSARLESYNFNPELNTGLFTLTITY